MKALIAYWRAKLKTSGWLMSHEDKAMIEQTIRGLRELEQVRSSNRAEREAEIVRTVKQLSTVQDSTQGEKGGG